MSLFEPDILIGIQFASGTQSAKGERRLWAAVLADALALTAPNRPRHLHREMEHAKCWIMTDGIDVGCFDWTCDILGLDSGVVRNLVQQGKMRRRRRTSMSGLSLEHLLELP